MKQIRRFMQHWIIPDKSIIIFCLVLLLIVWSSVWWQIEQDRQTTLRGLEHDGDRLARAFEEHVRRVLQVNGQYIALLKDNFETANDVTPSTQRLITLIGRDKLVAQLGILDVEGHLVASLHPDLNKADYSQTPRFINHVSQDTGRYFLDQASIGLVSGVWSIPFSLRLNKPDGSFAGVAYVSSDVDYFNRFYWDMNFDEEYVIRVVGTDGMIRTSSKQEEIGTSMDTDDLWQYLKQASSGFYRSSGTFYSKPLLISYRALADYPVIIQVGVAESVLTPMYQRSRFYLEGAGAISLIILFFGVRLLVRARRTRQIAEHLRENEARLSFFVRNTPIVFYGIDNKGMFTLSEGLGLGKIGLGSGEAVGHSAFAMYKDYPDILEALTRSLKGETVFFEHRVGDVYLDNRMVPIRNSKGQVESIVGAAIDITARVQAENKLKESYEELTATHEEVLATEEELRKNYDELDNERAFSHAVLESVPGLLYLYDQEGRLVRWNKNHETATGYSAAELSKMTLADWYKGDTKTYERICGAVAKAFANGMAVLEADLQNKDGSTNTYYFTAVKTTIDDKPYIVGIGLDVTERKQMEAKMDFLRKKDMMTGVYNRTYFETDIIRLQTEAPRNVGMFILDVDGLKLINDTLGHQQGDELLKNVAGILAMGSQAPEYVARIGGDEFAVVLPGTTKKRMEELEQFYQEKTASYNQKNPQLPLSLSLGWAFESGEANLEVLFKTADNNMYRQKLHQRQSVRGSIVQIMMQALEEKDHITEGHADRVGEFMERMGNKLKLPQSEVADLLLLAKFHDIGKVGISDSILKKPGRLSEDEMVIMRQHCEIGFRIAKVSPDLEPIAEWVLKHQEHWDGGGYPLGIKGEDIPVPCRILGIVDAFDAMTNDRPYRKAMTVSEALAELRRCAGKQFDPHLVNVFASIIENSTHTR